VVLGLELRAFTLSHSTSPVFVKGFLRWGLLNYLPGLALYSDPPDLCLLSSQDYRCEHQHPAYNKIFKERTKRWEELIDSY
jgi:hypothetical protein